MEAKTVSLELGLFSSIGRPVDVKCYFIVCGCDISLHHHLLTWDKNRNTH